MSKSKMKKKNLHFRRPWPCLLTCAVTSCLLLHLPASAQDKLHPQTHTQRAQSYKPLIRTIAPAKRVVNGGTSMLVRVRAAK